MRSVTYLAVFEPSADGYGVYFPDLPGCIGFGSSFEEAQRSAAEALGLHLYETAPGFLVSPVTVYPELVKHELDNKRVKTNVTLPAWLKNAAEEQGVNYSRLLEAALMEYLGIDSPTVPKHSGKKAAAN